MTGITPAQITPKESSPAGVAAAFQFLAFSSRQMIIGCLLTGAIVFLVYYQTAAPCAWWGDGLELTCAASSLGIPHPTGYPLYMLASNLVIRASGGMDPGRAMTLLSTTLLSLGCGILFLFYMHIVRLSTNATSIAVNNRPNASSISSMLPASCLTFATAFSLTIWNHATFAEVYPLTFSWVCMLLVFTVSGYGRKPRLAGAMLACLILGILSLNHYSGIALFPLGILYVIRFLRISRRRMSAVATLAGCYLACLSGYLYLPLRAASNPQLNWGDPSNFDNFIWVVTGGQFSELKLNVNFQQVQDGLIYWFNFWGTQWLPITRHLEPLYPVLGFLVIFVSTIGLVRLSRSCRYLAPGLIGCIWTTCIFSLVYKIPDIDAYFIVATPPVLAGMTNFILSRNWFIAGPGHYSGKISSLLLLVMAALVFIQFPRIDKSGDRTPLDWGRGVLDLLPENAIILTHADNDIYALWYQQMVLGYRTDVIVFGTNFIGSGWYQRYFEHPGRGSVTAGIRERKPGHKLEHDLALFKGTLRPNFSEDREIFTCYLDRIFSEYLNPVRINSTSLLKDEYRYTTLYPYDLPSFDVYELSADPALLALPDKKLAKEFRKRYNYPSGFRLLD